MESQSWTQLSNWTTTITCVLVEFIPIYKDVQHVQINPCDILLNKMSDYNHMILWIGRSFPFVKKIIWQNWTNIHDKKKKTTLRRLAIKAVYLNVIKTTYSKLTVNVTFNTENLKNFSSKVKKNQIMPTLATVIQLKSKREQLGDRRK